MSDLYFPWLELAVLIPLIGALVVSRVKDASQARLWCLGFAGAAFVAAAGAWLNFYDVHTALAVDPGHLSTRIFGRELFVLDELSAPLLALAALLYLLTAIATLRTKIRRFSFSWTLFSEAILLATLSCREPWIIISLLALSTVPPYLELRARKKPTRVYALHMGLFVALMALGWFLIETEGAQSPHSTWALLPLLVAVLVRSGIAPFHCWMTDLFEHATFGTALLHVTPMLGAYAAVRLVLPVAPDWVLQSMGLVSLVTAVYAAGMALVQSEARRFFCYVFLSHSALVLVGLETVNEIGLTGALLVWISVGLSLGGFGLTLRSLEARHGRLSLKGYRGIYQHKPVLAVFFLLTGMSSVGFPGTFGFLGTELLVDGAVQAYPYIGAAVVIAAAINGIAVMQAYFRLFTGAQTATTIPLRVSWRERFAVLTLAVLIIGGGLFPQPGVVSRHHAAVGILKNRQGVSTPRIARRSDAFADQNALQPSH